MIRLFQQNFCAISNCKGSSLVLQIFYYSFIIEKIVTPFYILCQSTTTDIHSCYSLVPEINTSAVILCPGKNCDDEANLAWSHEWLYKLSEDQKTKDKEISIRI